MSGLRHRQCRDEPGYYEAFQHDIVAYYARGDRLRIWAWLGLGDAVAWFTRVTGVAPRVKAMAVRKGGSCGCDGRQATLNRIAPLPNRLRGVVAALGMWRSARAASRRGSS